MDNRLMEWQRIWGNWRIIICDWWLWVGICGDNYLGRPWPTTQCQWCWRWWCWGYIHSNIYIHTCTFVCFIFNSVVNMLLHLGYEYSIMSINFTLITAILNSEKSYNTCLTTWNKVMAFETYMSFFLLSYVKRVCANFVKWLLILRVKVRTSPLDNWNSFALLDSSLKGK